MINKFRYEKQILYGYVIKKEITLINVYEKVNIKRNEILLY